MENKDYVVEGVVEEEFDYNTVTSMQVKNEYYGERVDMTDAMSILTYGNDILEEISKLRDSLYVDDSANKIGQSLKVIEGQIDSVSDFNAELDAQDEKIAKIEKRNNTLIGKIANKILGNAALTTRDSYKEALKKQNTTVEEITEAVDNQAMAAKEAHQYNKDYLVKLEEKIGDLKKLVDIGQDDLNDFERRIDVMKANGVEDGEDEVLFKAKMDQADKHIFLFKEKLATLESVRISTGQLFGTTVQKQTVYGQLMHQLYNVKTILMPILESTAKEAIDTRQQNEMLKTTHAIIEGTNTAIVKNSEQVLSNVQLSQQIEQKGALYTSTLVSVEKNIDAAAKIIANGKTQLNKAVEDRNRINDQMSKALEGAINIMKQSIEADTENDERLLQGIQLPELPQKNGPKQKKLGVNPATK